ncbi:hypothetical protein HN51_054725 [Arachis hypogaea]|uniref:DUF4378 domain-containing protein n=2 Tax=Arachis hypogaea TaxID=3818 RepID=A0A444XKA3_ARAHY|nr:uncharacterized protein LOC107618561 [Arachis ipaensis]XP_025675813.1 uncharacterized protein LOC112776061 [Arachis hypogaea]RYQ90111.1 hypothetical protein Ahy_B09g096378 [Arachis hypogaea]
MPMEMEKRRFKGRSFLSFFDWNSKSQKKLLFDKPNNLPEVSNQGKENVGNMPQAQMNKIKVGDNGASPGNVAASCDFNCALSISSDEGCETKVPGLVARLMGLDSLPASTVPELSSTSLYGSNSLGSSHCQDGSLRCMADSCPVDCTMPLKLEKSSSGDVKPKSQKVGNLPALRRFQNETLPPKSAKPIPVTHNKLLSPIKNPGYVQPRNVAQIMDAATKIIEASPLQYARNGMSSVGPSSVPLRILDLKEQLEGAQYESKLVNRHIANHVNGKPNERSNLYKGTLTFKRLGDSEKNSSSYLGNKGKSASVVIPSKADVQNRDTSALKGKKGHMNSKEDSNIKPNQSSRSQKKQFTDPTRAIPQRAFTGQNSNVLGQNNINHKGKLTSKRESNKPTTRTWSSESSTAARKAANKGAAVNGNTEPNRSSTRVIDSRKESTVSKRQSISEKKKYISRAVHNDTRGTENVVDNFENKSIKCNITTDRSTNQNAVSMSESKDVISFTFTSPLGRTMPESQPSTAQVTETSNRVHANTHACRPKKLSSSTLVMDSDTIDGDTLSVLLEKMLQELPSRINSPQCTLISDESSSGSCNIQDNGFASSDNLVLTMNQQLQTTDPMEEPSCGSSESGNDIGCQHSGAVTLFENPAAVESYLDCEYSIFGSTLYPSIQDEEVSNFSPWSEQSSEVTEGSTSIKQFSGISNVIGFRRSTREMELEYIKDILSAELMAEEFVIGETNKIIMPNLFDILEIQNAENYIEYSQLERKVLFDTVSDCLELRYRKAFVGSCKAWPEWVASVQRKNLLAEELLKEIISLRSMEEVVMVDELVHKDMSIGLGRWIDFDIEAFEEGLDVEFGIVTNLINELVYELMIV